MPFRALGLDAKILRAVTEAAYTEPTPIQAAAIPPIIAGQDLIGIAQTGTGKTAAFTLPILTGLAAQPNQRRGTKVLIIAPTRELVVQIEENVRAYAKYLPLTVATVFGGVGEQPQLRALRSGVDVVIACAGRLLDLMRQRAADFSQLKFLVLDEADRMLDMGFLPDIRSIVKQLPQQRQTLLFSATLSKEIESVTREFQQSPKTIQIGRRANPAETVTQLVYEVPKHLKTTLLLHLLQDPQMNMVLVFSRMKHGADRIARQLEQKGVRCATLHSNRSQNQRLRALKDFKDGIVRVLVATDIAARGIDVDGISHVVNYDFPMHPEDYVHRIGRTGRAHAVGDAISFVASEDYGDLRALERFIGRGLVRKKAEGFNYSQAPIAFAPEEEPRRFERGQNRSQPSRHPQRPQSSDRPQRSHGQGGRPQHFDRPQRQQPSGSPQRSPGHDERPQQPPGQPQHSPRPQRSEDSQRSQFSERPQRPQYSDRPQRPPVHRRQPQHSENSGRPQPSDRSRPSKPWDRQQRPQSSDRPQRPGGQGEKPWYSKFSQRPRQAGNPQQPQASDRPPRSESSDRPQREQSSGRPQRPQGNDGRPQRSQGYGGQPRRSGPGRWRR